MSSFFGKLKIYDDFSKSSKELQQVLATKSYLLIQEKVKDCSKIFLEHFSEITPSEIVRIIGIKNDVLIFLDGLLNVLTNLFEDQKEDQDLMKCLILTIPFLHYKKDINAKLIHFFL